MDGRSNRKAPGVAGTRQHPLGNRSITTDRLTAEYSTRARAEQLAAPCVLALQHTKPCWQGGALLSRCAGQPAPAAPAQAPERAGAADLPLVSAGRLLLWAARTANMVPNGGGGQDVRGLRQASFDLVPWAALASWGYITEQ